MVSITTRWNNVPHELLPSLIEVSVYLFVYVSVVLFSFLIFKKKNWIISVIISDIIYYICGAIDIALLDFETQGFKAWHGPLACLLCYLHATESSDSPLK